MVAKASLKYELYGILILIFSVIALSREGAVARSLTYLFRFLVGTWDFVVPLIFIYVGLFVMMKREWPKWKTVKKSGLLLFICGLLIMSHINLFELLYPKGNFTGGRVISETWTSMTSGFNASDKGRDILTHEVGGGMIGALLYSVLYFLFDNWGARLLQYTLFIVGFTLVTGISYVELGGKLRGKLSWSESTLGKLWRSLRSEKKRTASAVKTKTPVSVPDISEDDEFDEENYKPEPKAAAKKSLFFELLKPAAGKAGKKKKAKSDEDTAGHPEEDDEADTPVRGEEPVTVYSIHKQEENHIEEEAKIPVIRDFQEQVQQEEKQPEKTKPVRAAAESKAEDEQQVHMEFAMGEKPLELPYELPPLSLLSKPAAGKGGDSNDYIAVARKLEATLESFGVRAKVLEVAKGPAVTRFEIQPDVGVKVSRIVSLTDDIALALAAKDIRMEAPIPGKSAIGIEVPNSEVSVVTMREVMETSTFQESASKLSISFGRDISGQVIVGNLARMPHMLVAGATGSGKSVCINGIITSILYKARPDEVKFLMIDPKMVELNVYNGIPHLLAPVVTDPKRASLALKKVVVEMEKRYELFSKSGTRNIEGYNTMLLETGAGDPLPFIVVIVDELADLMMVAAGDVEDSICRLAQMARAAGIHLIIATQRPSVDVITGVIKANIPSRIAFGVSSQVDSRTILDMVGAEKLLGRGDMLYLPMGASKPIRVQGAFLSDHEVEAVVNYAKNQGQANYVEDMVPMVEETVVEQEQFEDELYDQAVQIILESKQASVSLLQRRMRVGYTRAARLIDSMEAKGIVGPYEGSKPREVLITLEQYQQNRMSS
ncbi:DNA translocase FtsK [Paenibacillus thalictri]|uniref:DNA translocase FtsK n=2 Tax=Paenibacillus thalictri TaxID=2527873 RepID=A0A4V2J462_9BACL|nr:DNA translocase FtsK [Paenibacillus thalictri]TBL77899.1 DNA translocase FtsK [Paenibacillus thalictri]